MTHVQNRYSDPSWHFSRAHQALGLGQNAVAARDASEYLTAAGWADRNAPYAAFIGAIAYQRLQQQADAETLLAAASKAVPARSWEATVVRYLQGQLTDETFLDRASDNGERTEARTYIGLRALIAGRMDEATKHFEWVKERGDRNYMEYQLALAELRRLKKNPVTEKSSEPRSLVPTPMRVSRR
jgi:lipoprotein NlpI